MIVSKMYLLLIMDYKKKLSKVSFEKINKEVVIKTTIFYLCGYWSCYIKQLWILISQRLQLKKVSNWEIFSPIHIALYTSNLFASF